MTKRNFFEIIVLKMKKNKKKDIRRKSPIEKVTTFSTDKVVSTVGEIAEPLCAAEGVELIHVEYQREPVGWVLRVYIGKPCGVTIADCTIITKQLRDILEIKLDPGIPYMLEVSSPGPDRPLSKKDDFIRFAGQPAKIRTRHSLGGQKNFSGVLLGILDDYVLHMLDAESVAIPYQEITKARLVNYNGDTTC
jgi:ribosome maturation factor RimP